MKIQIQCPQQNCKKKAKLEGVIDISDQQIRFSGQCLCGAVIRDGVVPLSMGMPTYTSQSTRMQITVTKGKISDAIKVI